MELVNFVPQDFIKKILKRKHDHTRSEKIKKAISSKRAHIAPPPCPQPACAEVRLPRAASVSASLSPKDECAEAESSDKGEPFDEEEKEEEENEEEEKEEEEEGNMFKYQGDSFEEFIEKDERAKDTEEKGRTLGGFKGFKPTHNNKSSEEFSNFNTSN